MARTTIEIQFLGTPDFALDVMLDYPRKFIRHIFRSVGETLDVTDICSADDLNRNALISDLRDANRVGGPLIDIVVTPGDSDVDGAGFGNGPEPSDAAPEDIVAGGGDDPGDASTYSRANHVHGIGAGEVGTAELADDSVTAAKVAVLDADGAGALVVFRVALTSGGATGAADDVTIFDANSPFAMRIIDSFAIISGTGTGGSSAALRSASGGGGTLLSGSFSTAAAGIARAAGTTPTTTTSLAAGSSLYLRRSDRPAEGELFILALKV